MGGMSDVVVRLVGVYNADGTVRGELTYFFGSLLGRAHCALCDISHGRVRERAEWQAVRAALPVPMVTFHRDDQPAAVREAVGGSTPVVVAELADGRVVPLLDGDELDRCEADPQRFAAAVSEAVDRIGLTWPAEAGAGS